MSKKYRLGTIGMSSLREDLSRWWNKSSKDQQWHDSNSGKAQTEKSNKINKNEFWALNDLNFSIGKGEVVGLIGPNGSGKSTLLKILSRITEPSSGEVTVRGKVSSLLEVGTGFHPELTGKENVYLNGAILGMTRKEVDFKFDEIVDFAGIVDFMNTPIKRYSSGMTVRLGFSVAAHLDTDILIVDEVLAVGDANFQQKCINKMEGIASSGKTIIFVSHQMNMIESLCSNCFLLSDGLLKQTGSPKIIIDEYLKTVFPSQSISQSIEKRNDRQGTNEIIVSKIKVQNEKTLIPNVIRAGEDTTFEFKFSKIKEVDFNSLRNISFSANIDNENNQRLAMMSSNAISLELDLKKVIEQGLILNIHKLPLMPGTYFLTTFLGNQENIIDWVISAFKFNIIESDFYSTGRLQEKGHGDVLLDYDLTYE